MKTTPIILLILGACLAGIASCNTYINTNMEDFGSADMFGMVYDNHNQACSGVRISLDGKSGPLSDVNGRFTLPNVSRGKHTVSIKKEDYEEASFPIEYMNRSQIIYLKIFSLSQILELAENALTEHKLAQADGYLARAEKIDKADPRLNYLKAVLALKRKRPTDALALLLSIIEQQTAEPYVYLAVADIYEHELKDLPKALEYLKKFANLMESEEITARIKKLEAALPAPAPEETETTDE